MTRFSGRALGVSVAAVALLAATGAFAQARQFNVPSEAAAKSIPEFARQAGIQITAPVSDLHGVTTPAIVGQQDVRAALERLIAATGLEIASYQDGKVVLRRREPTETSGAESGAGSSAALGEVVVTARKTAERLQDVPIAITALGGDRLRDNGHIRIEDLNQLVPSTNVVVTNGRQTSFTIRGLGANPANDGLESSAGVFLDGVYLGRPGMAGMDFIDIERIEVLRGPQGTLFGKNTTAGAINITTATPSRDASLLAQATGGNYGYQQYQATATGPLTDQLAGRLTAYSTTREGTIHDITSNRKTGTLDRRGVRGQLLFQPTDDFSARLIAEYSREQQSGGAAGVILSRGSNVPALQRKLDVLGAQIAVSARGDARAANIDSTTGARQTAFSAELNWNLGGFKLTSISAFRRWDYNSNGDTDATSADITSGGVALRDKQWSQEVRLALPKNDRVDAVIGAYYFGQRVRSDSVTVWGSDAAASLTGIPNAQLPAAAQGSPSVAALLAYNNSRWDVLASPETDSYAVFGQATLHLNPKWNVTAGVRGTHEKKSETVSRANPVNRSTGQPVAGLASQAAAPLSVATSDTAASYLLSTDYHATRDLMFYGLVSRGQKAGGVNAALPARGLPASSLIVEPETAMNYEGGVKSELLDRRLSLNLSLYRTDVRNYQASYLVAANGATVQYLTNVGRVRSQGVEAEATLRPTAGVSLGGYAGYTDAKYRSYTNASCPIEVTNRTICDLSGRPIAGAPKWTAGVNGTYERPLSGNLVAYLSGEYSWRSNFYSSQDDSAYSVVGDYGLLNLRLGLRSENGRWDIAVWGKNLTDEHYATNSFNFSSVLPGVYVFSPGDPETYGVTLRASF